MTAAETPLLEGRDVTVTDTAKTPRVAIVNQEFARRLFHTEHAVGRYFKSVDLRSSRATQFRSCQFRSWALWQMGNTRRSVKSRASQSSCRSRRKQLAIIHLSSSGAGATRPIWRPRFAKSSATSILLFPSWNRRLEQPACHPVPSRSNGYGGPRHDRCFRITAIDHRYLRARLLHHQQTNPRTEHSCRSRRTGEAGSRGCARSNADPARQRVSHRGAARGRREPGTLEGLVYQASARDPFVLTAVLFTMLLTSALSIAGPVRRALHLDPADLLRQE